MQRTLLGGVFGVGIAAVLAAGGCGGGGGTGTGTGGTGGGAVTSSASHSSGPTTSSGTGGVGGNHSFDTAAPLDVNSQSDGDLSPTGAVDYYTFQGTAGQALDIYIQAQQTVTGAAFDPTWIDTIITLYDENRKQIAENTNAVPQRTGDSELLTILPADGTYYVRVEECWTWAKDPKGVCAGTADKDNTAYAVGIVEIDPTKAGNVLDAETGDDAAHATPVTFAKASSGYYLSLLYGGYTSASDVDVFSLTVPADAVTVPAGSRGVVSLWLLQAGVSGNGSTTPPGKVSLVDPADPTKHLAEVNGTDQPATWTRMWPAVDLAKPYLVFVEHPAAAAGAHDFYVLLQGQGYSNPMETDDAANDVLATAEKPVDAPDTATGAHHYYVDGDLVSDTDVDHFQVPVSAGTTTIAVSCAAQRGGSGVRGFTVDILDATGATTIGTITETATTDAYTGYVTIPAAATSLVVRMSAKMPQDPGITGKYYHCGIHLQP
jgi:hypothetical protein